MRTILAVVALVAGSLVRVTVAAPIRLVETKLVEDGPAAPYSLVHLATGDDALVSDEPAGAHVWVRTPYGGQDAPFVSNRVGTVAVLNLRPATKWQLVYLLLSFTDGELWVIPDFGSRLVRLCHAQHKEIGEREIWVDAIEGGVLSVRSRTATTMAYSLKVRVRRDGTLRLLSYQADSFR